MTLDTAEPDLSVIVTGQGSFSQRQDFGEQLLEIARGAGYSAESVSYTHLTLPTSDLV